jgi:hypothetical protein
MKWFKRKAIIDEASRCPECGERVPEGAESCAMCGHAFEARVAATALRSANRVRR